MMAIGSKSGLHTFGVGSPNVYFDDFGYPFVVTGRWPSAAHSILRFRKRSDIYSFVSFEPRKSIISDSTKP